MEQRIGRIDRVRSQTERRLMGAGVSHDGDNLLQVFYPYLPETVEVFQVERVFERLNRFMRTLCMTVSAAPKMIEIRRSTYASKLNNIAGISLQLRNR